MCLNSCVIYKYPPKNIRIEEYKTRFHTGKIFPYSKTSGYKVYDSAGDLIEEGTYRRVPVDPQMIGLKRTRKEERIYRQKERRMKFVIFHKYDSAHREIEQKGRYFDKNTEINSLNKTIFEYNKKGFLVSIKDYKDTGQLKNTMEFTELGNDALKNYKSIPNAQSVWSVTARGETRDTVLYDSTGRKIEVFYYYHGNFSSCQKFEYHGDKISRWSEYPSKTDTPQQVIEFVYDGSGRVISTTNYFPWPEIFSKEINTYRHNKTLKKTIRYDREKLSYFEIIRYRYYR
jgi:hypothetical protein